MPRTLNDIIPPSRRRKMEEEGALPPEASYRQAPPPQQPMYGGPSPRRFPYATALIALVIIALSVGALYLFSGAKVTIDPSSDTVAVAGTYSATASGGALPFEVISVQKIGTQSVPGEGTETVNQAAQGTATVFNTQKTPQRLITNTRFETPAGLIFRIHAPIVVPAAKDANTPGSVTATLYADAAGESYNIGATTFTLPGLAGSPAFTAVTAKSSGPMAGGFTGTRPKVAEATANTARGTLKTALQGDLVTALKAEIPAGYVLLPGATFTSYQDLPNAAGANGTSVDVKEQGTATAVVFPSAPLASAIAAQVLPGYNGEPVNIPDAGKLVLTPSTGAPAEGATTFDFTLSGNTTIVWTVDPARIASAVAGKTREAAQVVLSGFPEVKRALLVLRPFWTGAFPGDPKDIDVVVNPPSGS
ncbi:MAG: hypothetical protein WDN10_00560 [bacterium]